MKKHPRFMKKEMHVMTVERASIEVSPNTATFLEYLQIALDRDAESVLNKLLVEAFKGLSEEEDKRLTAYVQAHPDEFPEANAPEVELTETPPAS
jgi:hypothetical protein